jgi:histidine ammonia-lyase
VAATVREWERTMANLVIDGDSLRLEDVVIVARGAATVTLAPAAVPRIERARAYIERLLAEDAVVYGVTTGFGKFAEVRVAGADALALQAWATPSAPKRPGP